MKTVTLNVEGISQGQWSTFLLELKSNEESMEDLMVLS